MLVNKLQSRFRIYVYCRRAGERSETLFKVLEEQRSVNLSGAVLLKYRLFCLHGCSDEFMFQNVS